MQIVAPAAQATQVAHVARRDHGIADLLPAQMSNGYALVTAIPKHIPPTRPSVPRSTASAPSFQPGRWSAAP